MSQELEKTEQMNLLIDFYGSLLTQKQLHYLKLYYEEDYSLGEIAQNDQVSRQAVYDNLKRAQHLLQDYEQKLRLLENYQQRLLALMDLKQYSLKHYVNDQTLQEKIKQLEEKN